MLAGDIPNGPKVFGESFELKDAGQIPESQASESGIRQLAVNAINVSFDDSTQA